MEDEDENVDRDTKMRGELNPNLEKILELMNSRGISLTADTIEESRQQMRAFTNLSAGDPEPVDNVKDIGIPSLQGEIDARVYEADTSLSDVPLTVFFHGGAFISGSIDTHDNVCRMLANRTEGAVVSVDYRLAPEHPFPAGVRDAYNATQWVHDNADRFSSNSQNLTVAGDSAGGTLSAVVSLMARDRGLPKIAHQSLLYPATAHMEPMESRAENSGYFINADEMLWIVSHYLQDDIQARNPYAFPLQEDDLSDLPPAHVITAGYDPLRDEGKAYAEKMEEQGVDVTYENYESMMHGFVNMDGILDEADEALTEVGKEIREAVE
ncbi:MAG: alpha/beta hydrolase [Halobacteria archaeon]|nr:alpha/beta hydrolase [Halobacteria archaeon]